MKYDPTDPTGPTAIGSCSRPATRRCCSTDAVPHRLRPRARRHQAVPAVGLADPRPPRVPPHRGRRGHHRAARPGLRQRVGIAIAEKHLRRGSAPSVVRPPHVRDRERRRPQEGISHEAASLAGHLQLGRMVYVYDDNHITIDGPTELAYSDDAGKRFEAYGWHVEQLGEIANDLDAIEGGHRAAMAEEDRPVADRPAQPHRLPVAEVRPTPRTRTATRSASTRSRVTKEMLGLPNEEFYFPPDVLDWYRGRRPAPAAAPRGVGRAPLRMEGRTAPSSTLHSRPAVSRDGPPSCPRSTSARRSQLAGRSPRA